jgi:WD40 repeat protein
MTLPYARATGSIAVALLVCFTNGVAQTPMPLWENRGSGPNIESNDATRIEFARDGRSMLQTLPTAFRRWDAESGRLLSVVPYDFRMQFVAGQSYSPDGRFILRRLSGYTLQLLDAETGRVIDSVQNYGYSSFSFSSDGRAILVTSLNRITFLSIPGLDNIRTIDGENLAGMRLAPDGRELLGIDNGNVVLRDTSAAAEVRRLAGLGGVRQASHALGSESAVGYSGQWLAIWNVRTGERTALMADRAGSILPTLVMKDGGRYAVTLSMTFATGDSTMRVWDILERRRIHDFAINVQFPLRAIAMAPDERTVVVLDASGTFASIDMQTGRVIRRFAEGHRDHATSIASSRDGRVVVTGSSQGELRAFDASDGTLRRTVRMESHAAIREIDVTSDGKIVASSISGGSTSWTRIFSLDPGDSVYREERGVGAFDISPDDRQIAIAGADGSIGIFELLTGREIRRMQGHPGGVTTVAYSPDGSTLASGGVDLAVQLWNVATGEAIRMLGGHNGPIVDVVFTRDGREVVSVATDRRIIASSLEGVQRVLATMPEEVYSLGISADGRSLLTGSTAMRALDIATGSITQNFWDPLRLGYGVVYVDKYPSTRTVVTASTDGDVVAWSVEGTLSVRREDKAQNIVVAPLPAAESLTITLPSRSEMCNVLLLDSRGATRLQQQVIDPSEGTMRMDVRGVESGLYLLVLHADGERTHRKIVIAR